MRSRRLPTAAFAFVAALWASSPSPSHAQGPSTASDRAADAAFEQGRTLLNQQHLVEACAKLEESDRLRPTGRAVLNLADCFERRGMIASAHARFLDAAQRAVEAHRADAEQHARARAARLESRLPRVVIVVPASEDIAELQITHQGRALPRTSWSTPEAVDPGTEHTYEATAPGKTFRATVIAEEGRTQRVELHLVDVPRAASVAVAARVAPAAPSPAAARPANPHSTAGYAALGAGAVGLVVGSFAALQVLSAKSTVSEHCGADRTCDADGISAATRGKTYSVIAPIGFGVGALGVGVGTYLLLRGSKQEARRTAFTIAPTAAPAGGGFLAQGEF